ncbi:WD40/YVTN/BNR-like repeat-containing protein [Pseudomonas sp. TTU2014-080ASC]|uniref:WD40/YVTN/BNR-like repeat-containing protein n=1 Tax=Pseudomonas sp. TTU2014-080ASC TaxID=1729724 RepID=UPI0007185631|nr:YCF48-related protein [Pseudomonas sp. TTU2014-080ASC]KRW57439.1 glycosyl hydrolase [Pseudomonas sp. TTU2014-080ASC]
MRQLIGYAMSLLVLGTVGYAFAPRNPAPLAETELHAERVQINDMLTNSGLLVAVGERGTILNSADNGLTWQPAQVHPQRSVTLTAVTAVSPQVLLAVGHDSWVVRSEDGGRNWHEVAYDNELGEPLLGAWSLDGVHVTSFGSYGKYFESADAGKTWAAREVNPDGYHINGMDGSATGLQILVGEQGLVMRSRDQGQSWETLEPFYNGSLFGVVRLSEQNWLTYGMRGNVFISKNAGDSWQRIELNHSNPLYGHVLLPENAGLVLVGADGTVDQLDANGTLIQTGRRSGLGTLTSVVAPTARTLLVGGQHGVFQGAQSALAVGH